MGGARVVGPGLFELVTPCEKWHTKEAGKWREKSSVQKGNVILPL